MSLKKDWQSQKQISRKDFLKMGLKGVGVLWALSFLADFECFLFRENQKLTRFEEKIVSFDDPFHPEDLFVLFRNALIARKLIAIGQMEQTRLGRQAVIPVVMGADHTGLVEFLEKGAEACERVLHLYPRWLLERMFEEFESLETVAVLDYNKAVGSWCVTDRYQVEGLGLLVNQEREVSVLRKEVI
jgi:hypothetical protein